MVEHLHSPLGNDRFGKLAERFARFFGTPDLHRRPGIARDCLDRAERDRGQLRWDPYPLILLNLAFSTQAAYAAPVILLAQTRQADRDKSAAEGREKMSERQRVHIESGTSRLRELQLNTQMTERIGAFTAELHVVMGESGPAAPVAGLWVASSA